MPSTGHSPLDTPFEGLLATPTSRLPYQDDVLLRSFVLRRAQGTLVVYNSPGVSQAAEAIRALGAPARLLVNHVHEGMYGPPDLEVPVWVPGSERAELARSLVVAGTFDGRQRVDDDLEVVPTPGHTAGTTCYLWDDGSHRFLFSGDLLWLEHGEWRAVVLDPTLREDYLDSLALVRDLDFDVLVPWGATEGGPVVASVPDRAERRARLDEVIERVRRGSRH